MTEALVNPTAQLRRLIEKTAATADASPGARVRELTTLRQDVNALLGRIDTSLAEIEKEREAEAMLETELREVARTNADLREELLRRGDTTPEKLDAMGYLSHAALDALEDSDALLEALAGVGEGWGLGALKGELFNRMVRRQRGGKFARRPGFEVPLVTENRRRDITATKKTRGYPVHGTRPVNPDVRAQGTVKVESSDIPEDMTIDQFKHLRAAERRLGDDYAERVKKFEKRIAKHLRRARYDPGEGARNDAGRLGQYRLIEYVREAASVPMTVDQHSRVRDGKRVWKRSRQEVHERILSHFLDPIPAQAPGDRRVLFVGGGYASGKSSTRPGQSVQDALAKEGKIPPDALVIDPDEIKAMLPEFQAFAATNPEANLMVYEEAWLVAQELQRRAQAKGVNVIVDGVNNVSADNVFARAESFKSAGYDDVRLAYITVPPEVGVHHAGDRATSPTSLANQRYIPEAIVRSVYRDISATIPGVLANAQQEGVAVEIWDNAQGDPWVYPPTKPPKKYVEIDPDADEPFVIGDADLFDDLLGHAAATIAGVEAPDEDSMNDRARVAWRRWLENGDEGDFDWLRQKPPPEVADEFKGATARRVLGAATDTEDKHSIEIVDPETGRKFRKYHPDRVRQVHDPAIDTLLRRRKIVDGKRKLDPEGEYLKPPPSDEREALFTAGGPASGKTTALQALAADPEASIRMPKDAVAIDPDEEKGFAPEYVAMADARDPYAGTGGHEESSYLTKRLMTEVLSRRLNLFYDSSGDGGRDDKGTFKFIGKMRRVYENGYKIKLAIADVPLDVAVERATVRGKESGRQMSHRRIANYHKAVAESHLQYRGLDWVEWAFYDTDVPMGTPPRLVARKPEHAGADGIEIVDAEKYEKFLQKAELNI